MLSPAVISVRGLSFSYRAGETALEIDSWKVAPGEHVFIHGPSGSGKTTLLGLLAGILKPQSGDISILGHQTTRMSAAERDAFRGLHIGYIFQMFNLLPYLTVRENIALPCRLNKGRRERCLRRFGSVENGISELSDHLKIKPWLDEKVTSLSVGQQQRVAAARALMGSPELIIADEPTSALDQDHREIFIKLLFAEAAVHQSTVVFVSHDRSLMPLFKANLSLRDINRAPAKAEVL